MDILRERGMWKRRSGRRHVFRRIGQGRKGERREGGERGHSIRVLLSVCCLG